MELTVHGAILIPFGLACFALSERWLYRALIFSVPFTATALINFSGGYWLTPVQLLGILWLARRMPGLAAGKGLSLLHVDKTTLWMAVFFLMILLSVTMPFAIGGTLRIFATELIDSPGPLQFSSRNLTTPLYVLFGLMLAAHIAGRNARPGALQETLRTYAASAFFVAAWGWLQFFCDTTGIDYPAFMFNNSENPVAQGYLQIFSDLSDTAGRVASVATEPSVMAQYLVSALPLVFLGVVDKNPVLPRGLNFLALLAILGVLLVSTSGTGLFGLALFGAGVLCVLPYMGRTVWFLWLGYILSIAGAVAVYVSVPSIKEFVDVAFLNKLATGSGVERLLTVQYAWGYFLEYPILGIGWGSATSNDLIVLLLSNCGILGFLAFAVLVGHVIARLVAMFRNSRRRHPAARITVDEIRAVMLLVSFLLLIALSVVGGFQYGFPYFWVILGLCVACTASLRGSLSSYRQRNTSRLLA